MNSTSKKAKAIKSVLPEGKIDHSQVKVRITIMVDGDVLLAAKELARRNHTKYQTLINHELRKVFLDDDAPSVEDRLSRLEKMFGSVVERKTARK
jgi:uncharacterized protein (DUF4415 family)